MGTSSGVRSEDAQLEEVERRMVAEFGDLPAEQVVAAVRESRARFADSPVRDFVPLLVERQVRRHLTGLKDRLLVPTV